MLNSYLQRADVTKTVDSGLHREVVGGMWDEIGALQLSVLKTQGLMPQERLLDIGCGSLRGGVHFVGYLQPGNYFGLDLHQELLDAGYEKELADPALRARLPRTNLIADENFDFSRFGETFDRALAFSLFTHVPINSIRVCLEQLTKVMKPGGVLHATFFELPSNSPTGVSVQHEPGGIITRGDSDPYHYRVSDFSFAIADLPWAVEYVGAIDHPRAQRLVNLNRLEDR